MNACTLISEDPNRMFGELIALESMMGMAERLLAWAKPRHDELMTELDMLTRPSASPLDRGESEAVSSGETLAVVTPQAKRQYIPRGYEYKGVSYRAMSKIEIFKGLMQLLLRDYPDKHADILKSLHSIGRDRLYLSRDRWTLFTGRDRVWVEQHSVALGCGWYLDTNLNPILSQRLMRAAAQATGLTWGKDVVVRLDGRFVDA
jgi:hypothetical protein